MADFNRGNSGGNFQNNNQRPSHSQGSNQRSFNQQTTQDKPSASTFFSEISFNSQWITTAADETLVTFADKCGKFMAKNGLTNSKIRSVYGEIKRIQMGDYAKEKSAFILLRPKVAYAQGRDPHNEGLKLFKLIFDKASESVTNDSKTFKNFCNLIEAILAYHKAYGGKD